MESKNEFTIDTHAWTMFDEANIPIIEVFIDMDGDEECGTLFDVVERASTVDYDKEPDALVTLKIRVELEDTIMHNVSFYANLYGKEIPEQGPVEMDAEYKEKTEAVKSILERCLAVYNRVIYK